MSYKSYDNKRKIELLDCPFCGGKPQIMYTGNDRSKKRKMNIKCMGCRVQRTDATLMHDFEWLENICAEAWNARNNNNE